MAAVHAEVANQAALARVDALQRRVVELESLLLQRDVELRECRRQLSERINSINTAIARTASVAHQHHQRVAVAEEYQPPLHMYSRLTEASPSRPVEVRTWRQQCALSAMPCCVLLCRCVLRHQVAPLPLVTPCLGGRDRK